MPSHAGPQEAMPKITLSFRERVLKVLPLEEGETLIGRAPDCDLQIDSLAVALHHARIVTRGGESVIFDLGGGLRVGGQPVREHRLADGDRVLLGKHVLTYSPEDVTTAERLAPEGPSAGAAPRRAWLQVLSGPRVGKALPLTRSLVRIGRQGEQSVIIARRANGYYVSALEGEEPPRLGDRPLGEEPQPLRDGDVLEVAGVRMQFFCEEAVQA